MTATINCKRCEKDNIKLGKPPFRSDLGEKIQGQICSECWQEWLTHQTLLINHYGLDPRDSKSKEFLYAQIESVLLNNEKGQNIDTSQQGGIEW
jgi:Fe-S cluster biosynthesis and repair protein YggX